MTLEIQQECLTTFGNKIMWYDFVEARWRELPSHPQTIYYVNSLPNPHCQAPRQQFVENCLVLVSRGLPIYSH